MESIPEFLRHFSSVFTRPAFKIFERLVKGFLEVHGPTAVTQLNAHKPPEEHFGTVYDFLKRYAWQSLDLAQALLDWLVTQLQPDQRVILAIDDTKKFKPHARRMEGVHWHAEHHRVVQTKVKTPEGEELKATGVVGQKGHCWVVLGLLHRLAAGKWCCFPLRAGLFLREKYCVPGTFEDKLQIAQKLLEALKFPLNALLVGDNFYGAARFVNGFRGHVLSHLKVTAVAYDFPEAVEKVGRGRPKKYGAKVLLRHFLDDTDKLTSHTLMVYGKEQTIETASFEGLLAGHQRPVKIVLVKGLRDEQFLLFTTDRSLTNEQMVEYYAARFQIEIAFRELKQDVGAFNYRLHAKASFGRYLQLAFVAYALLKYLAIRGDVKPKATAWYRPKGLASPARVQHMLSQRFQAQRIFEGVRQAGLLVKNTSADEFMRFAAS